MKGGEGGWFTAKAATASACAQLRRMSALE
jgi:hypothetical protein